MLTVVDTSKSYKYFKSKHCKPKFQLGKEKWIFAFYCFSSLCLKCPSCCHQKYLYVPEVQIKQG